MFKNFNQLIEDTSYDSVFGNILDATTNDALRNEFYYRYIGSENQDKFIKYFQNNLRKYKIQYEKYLEDAQLTVDPLELYKRIRTLTTSSTGGDESSTTVSGQESASKTHGGTLTKASTLQGSGTSTGTSTGSASYEDSNTDNTTKSGTDSETSGRNSRTLHSDTPQANVSASTVGGINDPITWTYASDITDNGEAGTLSKTNSETVGTTGSASGESENSVETSGTTTSTQSGSETTTDARTESDSKTHSTTTTTSTTNEGTEEVSEQVSGRNGFLISNILRDWESYIKNSNAFVWLVSKLDVCFLSDLDYDEDYIEEGGGSTPDMSDYYTKEEIDARLQVINNMLATKANITAFNNYYDKSEIDDMIGDIGTILEGI